ncbi:MAG: hypothetical protein QNI84_13230 [Henriciella sp.]|nr:hypothetical protein [Henriciella sp.]
MTDLQIQQAISLAALGLVMAPFFIFWVFDLPRVVPGGKPGQSRRLKWAGIIYLIFAVFAALSIYHGGSS